MPRQHPTLTWRRSTACANAACVEVAETSTTVHVRDSEQHTTAVLTFHRTDWQQFVDGLRSGVV